MKVLVDVKDNKADFALLIEKLEETPFIGKKISNDCFKIRLTIKSKGKGKSGGEG